MRFQLPSFSQWKQFFKVLTKGEKITLSVFFLLAAGSLIFLGTTFYINHTKVVPAFGGTYVEGVVGQPRFINPIYGETDDVDRSVIDLVFSGLMTYDSNGNIVPDLADHYTVSNNGETYDFTLKKNLYWDDGAPLTADDVVYTIQTIQNADYKSPLRANWIDVNVQKVSNDTVEFDLKAPYNSFLENCTVKIIPKHIWQNISPENFALSSYNIQPVGYGPYQFSTLTQDQTGFINTLTLQSNRHYYKPSFISNITFDFFNKESDLTAAANAGKINGFTLASLDNNEAQAQKEVQQGWAPHETFTTYSFLLPRYFAVFLNNQKPSLFSDPKVRQALAYATDTNSVVQQIGNQTNTQVQAVDSPILPGFYNFAQPTTTYSFNPDTAATMLTADGFKDNGSGQRAKAINKQPAFQFKSYLKIGSQGSEVTQLQSCLTRLSPTFASALSGDTTGKFGAGTGNAVTEFQQKYLPNLKPTGETGAATRQGLNQLCTPASANSQPLAFTLVTVNQPQLVQVANILKSEWQSVGITVTIDAVSASDIKPIIQNRSYDALLYGEALGAEPDLYPFWDSSQVLDPGLNLSSYQNKNVDQLLENSRETLDPNVKAQNLEQLQDMILQDSPAIFLYNPPYIYWVSSAVKGINTTKIIDPAKRFINISSWYIDTKRAWK